MTRPMSQSHKLSRSNREGEVPQFGGSERMRMLALGLHLPYYSC